MNKKSGLELMRIISMIFIIIYHIILHSGLEIVTVGGNKFLLLLLESFLIVHVNSFVLLTGYFQSDKEAKISKVISIVNATWFYKILCFIGILLIVRYTSLPNGVEFTFYQKLISILPLDRNENWYINCYLLVYIFSPYLNALINKLSRKMLKKLIIVSFVVFSLVGTLVIGNVVPTYLEGRSMITIIFLYLIGAYLRKYPIEESRLFNTYKDKMKKYVFLAIYIVFSFIILVFRMTSLNMDYFGPAYDEIFEVFRLLSVSFLSPLIIISSISYFLFFKNMNFSSKIINFIGGTVFGIYLLHENVYIRDNVYGWIHVIRYANEGAKSILMLIALGIVIFLIGMIIEIIRKGIYRFFYKRKFAEKLRNRIKDFIKSLGLNINY